MIIQKIKDEMSWLDNKRTSFFIWLCAVRVLPFIGSAGGFSFWEEKDRAKYLYAVLGAVDVFAAEETDDNIMDAVTEAALNNEVPSAIGVVARIAACSSFAKDTAYSQNAYVDVAVAVIDSALEHGVDLSSVILNDLAEIKSNAYNTLNSSVDIYGEVWNNFRKALKEADCDYWGRLYAELFQSGFDLDKEALSRRLNVPQEIKNQGAKAVAAYLEQMDYSGIENLNETRIIILGEKGSGKTCLARRLKSPDAPMTEPNESTVGVDTSVWKVKSHENSTAVNVHIWDFAGHVITHAAHRCFLSERSLYIIVYNGRTESQNRISYWLDHVKNYGGNAPVLILINEFDNHKPDIAENTLKRKYLSIKDIAYFSIDKDRDKLEKFRDDIAVFIKNNPMWNKQNIPANYYRVKHALENCFPQDGESSNSEHITKEKFEAIARENGINDKETLENLLKSLHELGVCLWYKDICEFNTLVLNPDWISHGIYKVINWAHNNSRHTVALSDYEDIFDNEKERYPREKLKFIFKLMLNKKYELAYSIDDNDEKITVPFLLKKDEPEELPAFSLEDSLMIKYVSEQPLPIFLVCRLIVRRHTEIKNESEVWRYGAVLNYANDTIGLIQEDDRSVSIKTKGSHKSEFILKLRDTMNDIFDSYKSEKPELQYRVVFNQSDVKDSQEQEEIFLNSKAIENHVNKGRDYFHSQSGADVPLGTTAVIYNIKEVVMGNHNSGINIGGNANFGDGSTLVSGTGNTVSSSFVAEQSILGQETASREIIDEILSGIESILDSGELRRKDEKPVQEFLEEAKIEPQETKWSKIKKFLSDENTRNTILNVASSVAPQLLRLIGK